MASLTVVPSKVSLAPGQSAQFQVAETTIAQDSVRWSVSGPDGADVGAIDAAGNYTPPVSVQALIEVLVTARAGDAEGTSIITLEPTAVAPVKSPFAVKPNTAQVPVGGKQQFAAVDANGAVVDVTWTVKGVPNVSADALGTIDEAGLYAAPATIASEAPIQIVATGKQDATRTTSGSVSLVSGGSTQPSPTSAPPATPTISIEPASAVLSAKAAQQFEARDPNSQPVSATWSLLGTGGLPPDLVGRIDATSGTYTAPSEIIAERTVIILAVADNGATNRAFIALTPGAVRIIPAEVTLRAKDQQQFSVIVQGDPNNQVEWQTSPESGTLAQRSSAPAAILYTAPRNVEEDAKVVVMAISKTTKMVGYANVTLLADPWVGWGPRRLGIWLMMLAIIVPVLYVRWPPPADRARLAAAIAAREEAVRVAQQRQQSVASLTATLDDLNTKVQANSAQTPGNPALENELKTQVDATRASLSAANVLMQEAQRDSQAKTIAADAETQAQKDNMTDERLIFVLVLLAGALGSFVHTTRSFVDFAGNQRLRPSWTWWYVLQPFTGSALAMVVYLVIRGGFFASATGATALNPWGFVAVAALVGLFSKQATNKLDELFSTMFRTDKDRELKDKL